jgi:hypothetical protein
MKLYQFAGYCDKQTLDVKKTSIKRMGYGILAPLFYLAQAVVSAVAAPFCLLAGVTGILACCLIGRFEHGFKTFKRDFGAAWQHFRAIIEGPCLAVISIGNRVVDLLEPA